MKKFLFAGTTVLAIVGGLATAQAADLPRRPAPVQAPAYVEPPFSWTGAYVGLNGGLGWGRSSFSSPFPAAFDTTGGLDGGTLGYNWQDGRIVFGIEGDIDWANIRGSAACAGTVCSTRNDWLGTVRGRLGYDLGRFMPYITGGLAAGNIRSNIAGVGTSDTTKAGWTVGGGIEAAFARNWSAKLEYLYVDFGRGGAIAGSSARATENVVRAGLNYRFNAR